MFVQTEITPNPNSLKFIPGKVVSMAGSFEVNKKDSVNNELIRNILSVNGVEGIFLSKDFISVNKNEENSWDDIKHIVISHINEFYASGKEFVINKDLNEDFRTALFKGMPSDKGLYMPHFLPDLSKLFNQGNRMSFRELSFEISKKLKSSLSLSDLKPNQADFAVSIK